MGYEKYGLKEVRLYLLHLTCLSKRLLFYRFPCLLVSSPSVVGDVQPINFDDRVLMDSEDCLIYISPQLRMNVFKEPVAINARCLQTFP